MNSISPQTAPQLGGVSRVFFVEHRYVRQVPAAVAGSIAAPVVLATGAMFAQLAGVLYTPSLDAEGVDTAQGPSYKQVVEVSYAGDAAEVTQRLAAMQGRRYLVLLQYFDGRVVVVGDRLGGLLFTSKFGSGRQPRERLGHTWRFEANTSTPPRQLTAAFPVEGLGLVVPGQPIPAPSLGPVLIRTRSGRVLGTAQPGQTVTITSAFGVSISIQ